ncbi:dTDP-6-deoxy-L-lyxo-4-hexulose reductase rmlD [Mycobacterium tuberculosis CAS/NITR204]|uniref:dTDP-4-dehydrorhamnose reductase n=1 Tax=Mycobacterium tuberculosis CAS/NITR204 TaxID=1310114 RepID=R4MAH4_MYCTX|nr:dTDP-6-deoxy-L-lyxo-4-hexulose reductase rmlD [Mycobacterium tuberculosis CAS/NITR204]
MAGRSERLVITGAGGQLGSHLTAQAAREGRDMLALTSSQWDITDPAAAERIIRHGDVVINCAAYTDVDGAESNEAVAYAVNATGPQHLARACARVGARLIHVSTDYVFDGDFGGAEPRPYSAPMKPPRARCPQQTRRRAGCAGSVPGGCRGTDRLGLHRRDRQGFRRRHAPAGRRTRSGGCGRRPDRVADPRADLAEALLAADAGVRVLHAANEGVVSRFGQARAVFEECGADPQRVRPVSSAQFPRPAPRSSYSALSSRQWALAGLTPLRHWRSALATALAAPALNFDRSTVTLNA